MKAAMRTRSIKTQDHSTAKHSNSTKYATLNNLPPPGANRSVCEQVINKELTEYEIENLNSKLRPYQWSNEDAASLDDCQKLARSRRFLLRPVTALEASFPIAFSILAYKDLSQLLNLLSLIYRPQNVYCVHIDRKAPKLFDRMRELERCLPNVIVEVHRNTVAWGFDTVLKAELQCMRTLLQRHKKWRYFINLTGESDEADANCNRARFNRNIRASNSKLYGCFQDKNLR